MFLIKVHFEFSISFFFLKEDEERYILYGVFILALSAMRLFKSSLLATLF